jgi:hypothetical protein
MEKIATKIIINPLIKKEIIDGEEYEYQEYEIFDDNDYLLERNKFFITDEPATIDNICKNTGIKLGVSAWIKLS